MCEFCLLHNHTEFSHDGIGKLEEMILKVKSMGHKHLGITDHGNMSALWEAQKLGDKHGIHIIHGCEFYYKRLIDEKNGHMVILAKDNEGLENMFRLQRKAYQNFYKRPRIDVEMLKEHKDGLIVTTACLANDFAQYIMEGSMSEAKRFANDLADVFKDDFYIEIQPNGMTEQDIVNKHAVRIADELGVQYIATNDAHYVESTDVYPHEVACALSKNQKMSDPKRFKLDTEQLWLKSADEMKQTFNNLDESKVERSLRETIKIAEKCTARLEKGNYLPHYYDLPEGMTERELLVEKIKEGAKTRAENTKDYYIALQNEIDVIDGEGYSGYFLIVADYVNSAKARNEIVGDGRGSGAGSKVAYVTGITNIQPSDYDLLFERFLTHGRQPDFDVDFSNQRAVFEDLKAKYGQDNVARIVGFSKRTPKSLARNIFRIFEHPYQLQEQVSSLIDKFDKTIEQSLEASAELREMKRKYPNEFALIHRLQNTVSHGTLHAGGVIIYQGLSNLVPTSYDKEFDMLVVEWDKKMVESFGLVKFDVLGLETIEVVHGALDSIEKETGVRPDLHSLDLNDQNVYRMLCNGDVSGVFQINNQPSKVMEQKPNNFKDLIAINALIRPGVGDWNEYIERRNGKEWSVHPDRLSYLEETAGLIAYQEQYLLDCKTFAGWDLAFADNNVRKNKDIRNDVALREKFINDSKARGYDVAHIWDEIVEIVGGGYGFNKSHSASYAMLSFQTAWLKHYHPTHFYASMMSLEKTDGAGQEEVAKYIAELKKRGIKILPPDINKSDEKFNATKDGITYRLSTIAKVGKSAVDSIVENRPYSSFEDFVIRRDTRKVNKGHIINLVKAGAFDEFEPNRSELLWQFDMMNRKKTQIKNGYECPRYDWSDKVKLQYEKETLGLYLSAHPMERFGFSPLDKYDNESECLQGGEVMSVTTKPDKKGNTMAFVNINTLFGIVRVLVFSSLWADPLVQEIFKVDNLVLVKGKRSGDAVIFNKGEVLS